MEVRSEQQGGVVMSGTRGEQFNIGLQQKNPVQQQSQQASTMQNMRLAFTSEGTAIYKPVTGASPTYQSAPGGADGGAVPATAAAPVHGLNMNMVGGELPKRKRGRPRKYGPDGTMSLALSPVSPAVISPSSGGGGGGGFSPSPVSSMAVNPVASSPPVSASMAAASAMKKARGRPPGSGKKQQMAALGSAGSGFTPHVITVKAGEDVSSKIMSFSQHGPYAVCILSANGAISNVTLRQAATSGGTVTYEGRFEILSLSGSFLLSESGGQRSRTGGLSVSLAGPDGRVLGGGVAGLLTAASPVQVVVGSFMAEGRKDYKQQMNPSEISSGPGKLLPPGGGIQGGTGSPPSRGTLSESSGGPGSPFNQSSGACNNSNQQGVSNMPWK